jgi:hypothetical protein
VSTEIRSCEETCRSSAHHQNLNFFLHVDQMNEPVAIDNS